MKVLLIQPPVRDFYYTAIRTQPLGLACLAAALRARGHEAAILDCRAGKRRTAPIPRELSFLREFYPFDDRSPFRLFTGFYHFGPGFDWIRGKIRESGADCVGIASSFTAYHNEALEIARIVKQEWDPKKFVIMGGAHPSCDPGGTLRSPLVDCVILGEGESRLPLVADCIEKGDRRGLKEIDGVGYRENGAIRVNPLRNFVGDLDALPFPARDLLPLDRYRIGRKRSTMLVTSRGCPHGCAYCSAHLTMGSAFRSRSPENVIREIADCRRRFGIEAFDIEDDNFTLDRARALKLMRLIAETFGERKLDLTAMNGVSFASLDAHLLQSMWKAGFSTINLSFVSSDPATKKRLGRPGSGPDFDTVLWQAEAAGLNVIAYAILGMPGQTVDEMVDTLVHLMGKRVLIGPSVYYPTPGTTLFAKCREESGLPPDISAWRSTALPIETQEFDRLDMVTLLRFSRLVNFVKKKIVEGALPEGITWRELQLAVGAARAVSPGFDSAWMDLLSLLFREHAFFSVRAGPTKELVFHREKSSPRVFETFFNQAWERPVRGSR
jgi:anaerobic magnesium-protoporphyrin IX monomethyl ester cyclase